MIIYSVKKLLLKAFLALTIWPLNWQLLFLLLSPRRLSFKHVNAVHFLQEELIEYRHDIIDAYYSEMALEEYLCFTNVDSYPDLRDKCQFYKLDIYIKFSILLTLIQNSNTCVNQTKNKSQFE